MKATGARFGVNGEWVVEGDSVKWVSENGNAYEGRVERIAQNQKSGVFYAVIRLNKGGSIFPTTKPEYRSFNADSDVEVEIINDPHDDPSL